MRLNVALVIHQMNTAYQTASKLMRFQSLPRSDDKIIVYRHELLNDVLGVFSITSSVNLIFTLYQAIPSWKLHIIFHLFAVLMFMLSWLIRDKLSYRIKIAILLSGAYLIIFSAFFTLGPTANSKAGVIVLLLIATIFLDQPYISLVFAAIVIGLIAISYLAVQQLIDFPELDSQVHNAMTWLNMGMVLLAGGSITAWVARSMINELISSKRSAEMANQAKSQFLINISHELRSPLNVILGFTDVLLEQGHNLTPAQYEQLSIIANSGNSLHRLVADVIDLERTENGRFKLQMNPVSLSGLIGEVTDIVRDECECKGLKLLVKIPSLQQHLLVDGERLKQILLNLLTNAIKFTERGTVQLIVEVTVIDEQQIDLKIEVADTGIGIALTDQERIFLPFEQINKEDAQGLGLGLAISRQLTQLMGGELILHSTIGTGSCFTLSFPTISVISIEALPNVLHGQPINIAFPTQELPLANDIIMLAELAEFRMLSELQDWVQANSDSYPQFCQMLEQLLCSCDFLQVENFLNTLHKFISAKAINISA
jgi:signal transduction histidine kinase